MLATHDQFLSYRWADKPTVGPLLAALRARGVRVWQDALEVEDLASIQQAVATDLAGSRALLAWYSSRYNESRACQWELTSAYTAAQAEGDPRSRVLVVNPEVGNAHVHLPELFDQLHLSAAGVSGDPAVTEALADRIQTALGQVPLTPLGGLRSLTPPLWLPAMGDSVGKPPQRKAPKRSAPRCAELRMLTKQFDGAGELRDQRLAKRIVRLRSVVRGSVDKLSLRERMDRDDHRRALRARSMAESTGVAMTAPDSSSARRLCDSAAQASSTVGSGERLARRRSARRTRSSGVSASAWDSSSATDAGIVNAPENSRSLMILAAPLRVA